ncbi:MAG TPA: SDR family NAD(P)-dependent oxidoreductase [Solirubrobacteraceae bacterium]
MTDFSGRVALVTGASGGIGRALADRLAGAGASVGVHYGRSADAAHQIAAQIGSRGGRAAAVQADLADPGAPEQLVDAVERELGAVDILVANHGRSRPRSSLKEVTAEEWDQTLAVNARAPFLLARRVLPGMRDRRFGRIMFTSSVAGLTGGVVGPDYAASKAALHGLTHYLAARVAADGVTVNAPAPALIENTGMLPGDPGDLAKMIPVGRLGTPAEVADLALAVLANGYVTSHVIPIDGGMHAS